jgi:Sap, sulfolipid-1-addressing protein
MYEQAAGLAALAALYPPALLIAAVYLSSASPRRLTGLYLTGAALVTAIAAVVILVVLRSSGLSLPGDRQPRYGLRVGLGVLAVAAAGYLVWRYRHRRPADAGKPDKPGKPAKPGRISRMTAHPRPLTALGVGALLFAPGVGFIAAIQVVATAKAGPGPTAAALIIVVVIYLAFAWLPLALHLIAPDATTRTLKSINAWLAVRGRGLMVGALAAVGTILIINGAIGLT